MELQERQQREVEFHREYAALHAEKADEAVNEDVIRDGERRPWNAYWSTYDALMALDLKGKRVLVPGCGFGEDAIRMALLGAEVLASDLSTDVLAIARARAAKAGVAERIHFDVMAAEHLTYADDTVDLIYFNDILHHVEIPGALAEARRVLRPDGQIVANELYTHTVTQRIRASGFVARRLYPRMVRFIYGTDRPYITEDEHKIDEKELGLLLEILSPGYTIGYFLLLEGRLFPSRFRTLSRIDHAALRALGRLGGIFAGRVVVSGHVGRRDLTT